MNILEIYIKNKQRRMHEAECDYYNSMSVLTSVSDLLISYNYELFLDHDDLPCVSVETLDGRIYFNIDDAAFDEWLGIAYFIANRTELPENELINIKTVLRAAGNSGLCI